MSHVKPQENRHNGGWTDCSQLDMQNAWVSFQTPDFSVNIHVEIRINFHEGNFIVHGELSSQGIDTWC